MGGGSKGGSSPSIPKPPPISKSYQQGVDVYLKNNPALLGGEQAARGQYDPQRIAEQQGLQQQFGPAQYQQQLDALAKLDPQYLNARAWLGRSVIGDLQHGTSLDAGTTNQLQQQVRGAQSARGNAYGDSAGIAEAYTLGDRGQQLYQQRLQNAAGFISQPTLATQAGQVSPVSPDRSAAYVDPNAGFQGLNAANANYAASATAAAANAGNQQSSGAGWGSTIGGIVGGVAGTVYGGPTLGAAGYQVGSGVGGGVGSLFSDRRMKTDIEKIGKDNSGVNIYKFAYKGPKHIGYMADEIERKFPGDVSIDPVSGYKMVSEKFAPVRLE